MHLRIIGDRETPRGVIHVHGVDTLLAGQRLLQVGQDVPTLAGEPDPQAAGKVTRDFRLMAWWVWRILPSLPPCSRR